ncbi:DNA replication licensing factor MCM3 [Geodia barretti]|uniref:DNA replication licensing factor MCM3 n=1 Tax=Geodia barretti TaxID=519541 RepID=A0AA35WKS0_GEOBA|nr:DNA replication licensing factor MCM3 [Geodia barretti]
MDAEQDLREHQRQYLDFLDDSEDQGLYNEKVRDMIRSHSNRLLVNINDLRRKNGRRAMRLLNEANIELLAFQRALKECVLTVDDAYGKQFEEFHVGFEGSFGSKHVTPRSLSADLLGCLVCVEGIITKSSQVRPKVVKSVHYCPATGKTMERKYTDLTSLEPFPTSAVYPTKDEDGNSLETEYGLSVYRDHQTLSIQETPERAPAGQLPRVLDVILDGDLVDSCKPGDRVHVVGTYRCLPGKKGGYTSGTFRTVLLACSVIQQNKEAAPLFSRRDVAKIKKFSKNNRFDPFEMLAHSLAPSIHGHTHIKKAVLAMLLGGVEKILENGTRLRGDINILLVGDPSTAKSQMLRYVLHSAPRAVTTTGRGTSGVGLTAAVTTDMETGDRQLEAGAMVLADRGVVCIDEFDKMSDLDRTAIHEVMEQGRVTIAKAGIHAKLNARCSVLAAANPVYGRYDDYKAPMDNIGMQDSLLSRFDLIFVVLDEMDPEQDRRISEHVLRMHRYRNPGEQDGEVLLMGGGGECLATGDGGKGGVDDEEEEEEEEEVMVFDKHDALLHGDSRAEKFVSSKFLKKYIHVARALKPVLTREACDLISTEYAKLRAQETANRDTAKTQPVTARTLETLIRLSTAHAKARMSKHVEEQDAESAINLVNFAYFKKVAVKPRKKKKDKERKRQRPAGLPHPPKKRPGEDGYDPYDFSSSESEGEESAPPTSQSQDQEVPMDTGPVQLSAKRS